MRIGFIGAGHMGHGMALNLLLAGHDVTVIAHRNRAPIENLISRGAHEAKTLQAVGHAADVVVVCLPSSPVVRQTLAELLPTLTPGTMVIDTTTNEPAAPEEFARMLSAKGVDYVEAPVTGGVKQAEEGVLGAIVGCDSDHVFNNARSVLTDFCGQVEHFGPVGMGARTKLISNFLALGTATLVIETFKQARALGVDWKKLYELALLGSGKSVGLQRIVGNALEGDYQGYVFSLENTAKDFSYVEKLFSESDLPPGLSSEMKAIFDKAIADGHGDRMLSELLDPKI